MLPDPVAKSVKTGGPRADPDHPLRVLPERVFWILIVYPVQGSRILRIERYFRFLALLMVVTGGIHGVHAADELNSLLERGQKQLDAGQLDEALASYQQAVQKDPNSSLAYTRLGGTRLLRQEYGDSITDFQQAIMLDQTNAGAFLGMAMAYLHLGRYELARQSLNEAERLDPSKKAEISKVRTWLDSRSDSPPH